MVFPRKIPTTKPKKCLEKIVHQKISEEKSLPQKTRDISTKNFSQAKFLPKIPTRGSLYQKIFEETFFTKKCLKRNPHQTYLPRISAKNIYIYEETEETFSTILLKSICTKKKWRDIPAKKIDDKWLPKIKRHLCEEISREISTKKNLSSGNFLPK